MWLLYYCHFETGDGYIIDTKIRRKAKDKQEVSVWKWVSTSWKTFDFNFSLFLLPVRFFCPSVFQINFFNTTILFLVFVPLADDGRPDSFKWPKKSFKFSLDYKKYYFMPEVYYHIRAVTSKNWKRNLFQFRWIWFTKSETDPWWAPQTLDENCTCIKSCRVLWNLNNFQHCLEGHWSLFPGSHYSVEIVN